MPDQRKAPFHYTVVIVTGRVTIIEIEISIIIRARVSLYKYENDHRVHPRGRGEGRRRCVESVEEGGRAHSTLQIYF